VGNEMDTTYLLTFENTFEAMRTEERLKIKEIKYYVMPTPTEITKSCGICICIEDYEGVKLVIIEDGLNIKAIYKRENSNYNYMEE
jgi:hypothetical protein